MWPLSQRDPPAATKGEFDNRDAVLLQKRIELSVTPLLAATEARLQQQLGGQISALEESIQKLSAQLQSNAGSSKEGEGSSPVATCRSGAASPASPPGRALGPHTLSGNCHCRSSTFNAVSALPTPARTSTQGESASNARHSTKHVWSLVESDAKAMTMLADVRKAIDGHAEKHASLQADGPSSSHASVPLAANTKMVQKRTWRARRNESLHYVFGPVLHPDNRFRTTWNVLLALFICYCGIAVPLEIAFEVDMTTRMCSVWSGDRYTLTPREDCPSFQAWFWINVLIDFFFIVDILVNLRTGYIQEGRFVDDDWLVARNYLRGSFTLDFIGSFPINLMLMAAYPDNPYGDVTEGDSGTPSAARVNRLLRLIRLSKLAKLARMFKLQKYLEGAERIINPGFFSVLKLVTFSLLCCHWFGCLWWLVSELERLDESLESSWSAGENNWVVPVWLQHERSFFVQYMHAFFWGAGMVTSMVPYDIEPITGIETFVTTLTMICGLMINALVISSLTTALASMNSKRELTGKQLSLIKNYLLIKSVPADLRSRVLEYYEYLFTSSAALADLNMFSNMPPALSAQLNLSVNRRLASRCTFFRDVSNTSLVTLISELHPLVFVPNQTIVVQGHHLVAVYFINKGRVLLLQEGQVVAKLRDNDNFGLDDYMAYAKMAGDASVEAVVTRTAKALSYCDVMSLDVDRLVDVMAFDDEFQRKVRESSAQETGDAKPKPRKPGGKWKLGGGHARLANMLTPSGKSDGLAGDTGERADEEELSVVGLCEESQAAPLTVTSEAARSRALPAGGKRSKRGLFGRKATASKTGVKTVLNSSLGALRGSLDA